MEENVTFGGIEAEPLTLKDIQNAVELLRSYPVHDVASIGHNCDKETFKNAFNVVESASIETSVSLLFGMPVLIKSYIPLGEVWFLNKNGKVLNKFKLR